MTNRYVPIRAHDEKKNGTGVLVEAGQDEVSLAHNVAENPSFFDHGDYEERDADQEAFVRDRQVYDVHVRDRLHFGVADHDVDDEGVAHKAHDADDGEEYLLAYQGHVGFGFWCCDVGKVFEC